LETQIILKVLGTSNPKSLIGLSKSGDINLQKGQLSATVILAYRRVNSLFSSIFL